METKPHMKNMGFQPGLFYKMEWMGKKKRQMFTRLHNDMLKIGVYHCLLLLMESNVSGKEVLVVAGLAGPGGSCPVPGGPMA